LRDYLNSLGGNSVEKARSHSAVPEIPNKLYFRIGEVSDIVGVKPYVLRYWESEFPDIKPSKSKSGQRLYKRRDVDLLLRIRQLLYEERFTINGARKRLREWGRGESQEVLQEKKANVKAQKQIEAFPSADETIDDDGELLGEGPGMTLSGSGSKVLKKIRRDLEALLEVVQPS
jgi:DNA-binding transcriptional MerR regulator